MLKSHSAGSDSSGAPAKGAARHAPERLLALDAQLEEAARNFGTPLYLYDAASLAASYDGLRAVLPEDAMLYYSVKANPTPAIVAAFASRGAHMEVSSLGEIHVAAHTSTPAVDLLFVAPGRTPAVLEEAVVRGVGIVVVDSPRELADLQRVAVRLGRCPRVALRINPGPGRGAVSMGGATQFGMSVTEAAAILADDRPFFHLELMGLHAYLGTGILDWFQVLENTRSILRAFAAIQQRSGRTVSFADVGGGFGIPYHAGDPAPDWDALRDPLRQVVEEYLDRYPETETLAFESGRLLVGPAGVFLARVVEVKRRGENRFLVLDGGTSVFGLDDRYAGLRPPPLRVVGHEGGDLRPATVCGPLCTSADRLAAGVTLPAVQPGDLVAFYQAGAYGLTASRGLFLSHGFPREVLLKNGTLHLVRERLDTEALLATQPLP